MSEQRIKEIVCIDLGSTNSQMGHKYINIDTGETIEWYNQDYTRNLINDIPEDKYNTNIPTVLLKWIGNPESKPMWEREVPAGKEVFNIVKRHFVKDIEVIREFKKDLYYSDEEKKQDPDKAEKNRKALEYTQEFFSFLKEIKEKNVAKAIVPDEIETIITVPARSRNEDMTFIKKCAEKAGWKNITTRDEARSAMDYAIHKPDSELLNGIKSLTVFEKTHVLLIDIGGSTTDIIHAEIRPDGDGGYKAEYCAVWPSKLGETDTLGGIDIDKAVAELMIKKGYVIDSLAQEEIKNYGYEVFRAFKEQWSSRAKIDEVVPGYGQLDSLTVDMKTRQFAKVLYDEIEDKNKLGRLDFYALIKSYLEKMQQAIRNVLLSDGLQEKEIDYIVLTGGGSSMFGIEEMMLGELDLKDPLDFTKLKENPERIIHGEPSNPSAVCCLGNLFDKKDIQCVNHINGTYTAKVDVFIDDVSTLISFCGSQKESKTGMVSVPDTAKLQFTFDLEIASDKGALPISGKKEYAHDVEILSSENFLFRITVYREDSSSGEPDIECSWLYKSERGLGKALGNFFFGSSKSNITLKNEIKFSIDENRHITIRPSYFAEGYSSYTPAKQI